MNSFFNAKKIIASLMVTAIMLSSVSNTAYGAQTKNLATTTIETAVSIETLSIQEKLKLYVDTTKKQYENYMLLKDYRFFDPEKYLLNNPDVMAAAEQFKAKDLNSFALTHYLYFGIFEGRSSQTPFDPIVALVSDSDIFNKLLIYKIYTPEKYDETIDITNDEELDTVTEAESESKPEAKEDFEHEEALEPEFQQDSESEQASEETDSDADSDTETGLTKEN